MTDLGQTAGKSDVKSSNYNDEVMRVFADILSGVLLYGGLGWVGDHFLHTEFLMPAGAIVGLAAAVYLVVKRHGSEK